MADDRLNLRAGFKDDASAGVKKLGKTLAEVKPGRGMEAVNAWTRNFRKEADEAFRVVRPLQSGLSVLGVGGLAASFSLGEIAKQLRSLSDSTLNMKELGRQASMTVDDIRRLQYAANKLHVDPAAMSNAIGSWSSKMVEFKRHLPGIYTDLMRQNADVARKIEADSPVDALKDSLRFLSQIKDPQIQKRWADDFGLGDLVPMLGKGLSGLNDAFAEGAREVKPITADMIAAADKLNESTVRLGQRWENLTNDVGPKLIDPLTGAIDKFDAVIKEGEKLFSTKPEAIPPRKPDGSAGESTGEYLLRTLRNTLRVEFSGNNGLAQDGQSLWDNLFGTGPAHAEEAPRGKLPPSASTKWTIPDEAPARAVPERWQAPARYSAEARARDDAKAPPSVEAVAAPTVTLSARDYWKRKRAYLDGQAAFHPADDDRASRARAPDAPPSFSDKWAHPDDDRLSRARPLDLEKEVREGSKAGIIQGLRELAQQQELNGEGKDPGGSGPDGKGGVGAPSMRYGRNPASGQYRRGGHSGGGRGYADTPEGAGKPIGGTMGSRAADYMDYLVDKKGWTPEGAAILLGNGMQESSLNPGTRPGDPNTPGGSHYMFQWNNGKNNDTVNGRRAKFERWARENNRSVLDPYANLDFADEERKHRSGLEAQWHRQTDLHNAGRLGHLFEGYGDNSEGTRVQNARNALEAYRRRHAGGGAPHAQAPVPAGTPAAAVTDAQRFAAQQRIINGSRDPADRALIDRYKAQQAQPQGHRAGGWIRGAGTGTSDSIPAMLSHGEYVINARASNKWGPLLDAINGGDLAHFASGGPVGPGVDQRFYPGPKEQPTITAAEGHDNRRFWRSFMRRPRADGGMGASWRTTIATLAMMQGESGQGLNSKLYDWDVNGPSGGVDQLHDVTKGKQAGKLHRLTDLQTLAMQQHADWRDPWIQAANFKKEALGSMNFAYRKMAAARSTAAALKEGIDKFENPANHALELRHRMPNIIKLQREAVADGAATRQEMGPLDVTIRHHPHTGHPIVTARAGKGVRLNLRSGPTMRPT